MQLDVPGLSGGWLLLEVEPGFHFCMIPIPVPSSCWDIHTPSILASGQWQPTHTALSHQICSWWLILIWANVALFIPSHLFQFSEVCLQYMGVSKLPLDLLAHKKQTVIVKCPIFAVCFSSKAYPQICLWLQQSSLYDEYAYRCLSFTHQPVSRNMQSITVAINHLWLFKFKIIKLNEVKNSLCLLH